MTCIVGVEHDNKVWIGGDSAGSDGAAITIRADEKVWAANDFAFGFTDSFRMGQLLRYKLELPTERPIEQAPDMRFMATHFIDSVRTALKDGGYAKVENGVERGGTFLVGWRGKLYKIESDFQIGRSACGYHAVGSGDDHALGALHALRHTQLSPEARILAALSAAQELGAFVREPFKVVQV